MLSLRTLEKSYGQVRAVKGISFDVNPGDIFTLLGPSGCGKTTTLQCIAGLETPTSGEIRMADTVVYSSAANLLVPANRRRLGMVFQSYAIWPHMSVFENVAFPLVHGGARTAAADVRKRVLRALDMVKMASFADRPAPHLSGGQQQRIALARAIVHEPRLLLLDEPLSNLDAKLRDVMRVELRQLIKDLGITTIFVTHDQVEALSMSDQIVVLRDGMIVQKGTPRQIYLRPQSSFVSDFMGRSNLIPGRRRDASTPCVEVPFGTLTCVQAAGPVPAGAVCVAVRPQAVDLHRVEPGAPAATGENTFTGNVTRLHFLGDVVEAEIAINGYVLRAATDPYRPLAVGDAVALHFAIERCVIVADDMGVAAGAALRAMPESAAA